VALTARQLLSNTPGIVKLRTRICSVVSSGKGQHLIDPVLGKHYQLIYSVVCLTTIREVTLKYIGKLTPGVGDDREQMAGKPDLDSELWVSCTCPFHLYNTEYALTKNENSDIIYSNGNPAYVTNPRNIAYVCKHILMAVNKSLSDTYVPDTPIETKKLVKEDVDTTPSLDDLTQKTKEKLPPKKDIPIEEVKFDPKDIEMLEDLVKEVSGPKLGPKEQVWRDQLKNWLNTEDKKPIKDLTWREKLTNWLKDNKEEAVPKGKEPVSWTDRLTKWLNRK
jgi:hypothetical protein